MPGLGKVSGMSARRRGAVAVMFVLGACRTPSAAPRPPADGAASPECKTATVYVVTSPTVFVAAGEQPFILLDAAESRWPGELSFGAGFMASFDPSDARTEDAPRRAAATAAVLLDAFTPVLTIDVRSAVLTAVFGRPGSWGVGLSVPFVREAGRWRPDAIRAERPVFVPHLPGRVDRHPESEGLAVGAAREFLERADRGDYDGSWELASAVVKAATSRQSFEDALRATSASSPSGDRRECFRQYAVRTGDLAMGDVIDICFASAGGVDTVRVRLDDDQEWRVVHIAHLARGNAR
jgi:Protein of unknown function (DUF4019)